MTKFMAIAVVLAGVLTTMTAGAQAPAGATGQCKDNSYTTAAKKWQACAGHKGVQTWYADAKGTAAPAVATVAPGTTAPAAKAAPAAAPAPATPAPATSTAASKPAVAPARTTAAPGGGPGMVWVNTSTNVYHCPGGTFYGKTKEGKYMSEADAKAAGARPDRNKPCSK